MNKWSAKQQVVQVVKRTSVERANMFEGKRLLVPGRKNEMEEYGRINSAMQLLVPWISPGMSRFFHQSSTQIEVVVM